MSPAPATNQRIWAIDTDRNIKVDYEQLVWKDNYVSGFDVEVGNTVAMQKGDAIQQLATKIHDLAAAAEHPEV
jgi:hypothetical protein